MQLLENNPLWQFACQQYHKPQCQQALLALQDQHGLNVNMLLFMHYANTQRAQLGVGIVQQCLGENAPLVESIQQLRQQRRVFKYSQPELYEAAKAQELALEQLHLASLWQAFTRRKTLSLVSEDSGEVDNIASYLGLLALGHELDSEFLALLKQLKNSINGLSSE